MTTNEWTDETWNPVRGCTKISPGCKHCYAERFAERWRGTPGHPYEQGFDLRLVHEALDNPLHWRKPRRVFVNSMADLFHEDVPDDFIAAVFGVMASCPQHTFQILTKRPERMLAWFAWLSARVVPTAHNGDVGDRLAMAWEAWRAGAPLPDLGAISGWERAASGPWPLPNVWVGVSVEDQRRADGRIPLLLRTPAAVRFLSCEPLLESVNLDVDGAVFDRDAVIRKCMSGPIAMSREQAESVVVPGIDWVIVGGENGCDIKWIHDIVRQCRRAGVPAFVKQLGARLSHPKGADMDEWPADLRVREMP